MSINIILIIVSAVITAAGIVYSYTRKNKDRIILNPNGKSPGSLEMYRYLFIIGLGSTMVGSFKYRNGANISYHCFVLSIGDVVVLPLIPLGCYVCENFTNISGDCPAWSFGGSQPWLLGEVLTLYSRWFWIVGGIASISLLIALCS